MKKNYIALLIFLIPFIASYGQDCTISGDDSVCINDTVIYTADGNPGDYVWTLSGGGTIVPGPVGANSISINWSNNGTFIINVSSINLGCTSLDYSVLVKAKELKPEVTTPITYCENETAIQLEGPNSGSTYLWYDKDLNFLGEVGPIPDTSVLGITEYYISKKGGGASCDSEKEKIEVIVTDDSTPPETPTLSNVTGECTATAVTPTTTDTCAGTITGTTSDPLTYNTQGTHIITWNFDDGNGNAIDVTQNVIINDVTNPVIPTLADVTGECTATAVTPTTTDTCAGTITGTTSDPLTYNTQGTHIITWNFDDGNGNAIDVTQNVIINDVTNPVIPTLADVTGACTATAVAPTTTDICAGIITGTTSDPLTYTTQGTHIITWNFDDGNGNTIDVTQNVIIDDVTAPLTPTLSDVTVGECSGTPTAPTTTDACVGIITGTPNVTFPITTQGTTVVTWIFADGNGNSTSVDQNVIVDDATAPLADAALTDITTECSVTSLTAPSATDNCVGSVTGTHDATLPITGEGTNLLVTWTYDDGNGNISTQTQNVTIDDLTSPTLTVIPDQDENLGASCSFTIPDYTGLTIAADNCTAVASIVKTQTPAMGTVISGHNTTQLITITADDGNGNTNSTSFTITLKDVTNPLTPTLPDVTGECTATAVALTTTDACAGTITGTTSDPLTYNTQGIHTITWNFNDGNGNDIDVTQNVIIDDITDPETPILDDITGECMATAIVPTTADDCSGTITGTTSDPLTYTTQGTHIITWNFDDGNGNTSTQTQNVIIDDITDPETPTLSNVTGECTATAVTPTTTDICAGTITGTTSDPLTYTTQGTHVITWNFDDGNGNAIDVIQNVIIDDVIPPVLNCPVNQTVVLDSSCNATMPDFTSGVATDNCGVTITQDPVAGTSYSSDQIVTVTLTADDGNGQSVNCSFDVHFDDQTPPVITCPVNQTVVLDSSCNATMPDFTFGVATDNCGVTITQDPVAGTTYSGDQIITVTLTADDGNGQSVNCSFDVHFDDQTPPLITNVPLDITVECDAIPLPGSPIATDNCDVLPTISMVETITLGSCENDYLLTRTWTAIDINGNSSSASQEITVIDNTNPVLVNIPADITVECDAVPIAASPTATDNCDSSPDITFNETIVEGRCPGSLYEITRTWTATDNCGNSSSASQIITVQDTNAPVLTAPADVTVECDAIPPVGVATATDDNCDPSVTIVYRVNMGSSTKTNNGSCTDYNYTITRAWSATDCAGNTSWAYQTITVVDTRAPVLTIPEDVTVDCENVPVVGSAIAVDTCDANPTIEFLSETSTQVLDGSCDEYTYEITRTWRATDACGNSSEASQIINVRDVTPPDIANTPNPIDLQCTSEPIPSADTSVITGISDNCSADTEVTWEGDLNNGGDGSQSNPEIITRIFRVTDACGNFRDVEQIITVKDTIDPIIPTIDSLEHECSITLENAPTTTDECSNTIITGTTADYPIGHVFDRIGTYTINWEFDDGNGNVIYVPQQVIIGSDVAPVPDVTDLPVIDVTCEISFLPIPTATDSCNEMFSGVAEIFDIDGNAVEFPITEIGEYDIVWTYTDGNGNASTQPQKLIVGTSTIAGGVLLGQIDDALNPETNTSYEPSHSIAIALCPDEENPITIRLTDYEGEIVHWEIFEDGDKSWDVIRNSDGLIEHHIDFNYSGTKAALYRVLIQVDDCYQYSTIFDVHAIPPDIPPVLEQDNFVICPGTEIELVAYSGYTTLVEIDDDEGGRFNTGQFPNKWDPTQWKIDGEVAGAEWTAAGNNTKFNNWSGTNNHPVGTEYRIEYDSNDFKFGIAHGDFTSQDYIDEFGGNPTTLETPIFSLIGLESAAVEFDQAWNLHAGDFAVLELSLDGGISYNITLQNLIGTSPKSYWWDKATVSPWPYQKPKPNNSTTTYFDFEDDNSSFDISQYIGEDNVRVRWTFFGTTDESVWAIDNISIPLGGAESNEVEWTDGLGEPGQYIIRDELTVAFRPQTIIPGYHQYGATTIVNGCRTYDIDGTAFADVYINHAYAAEIAPPASNECGGAPIYLNAYDNTLTARENAAKGAFTIPAEAYDENGDCYHCDNPGTMEEGIWSTTSLSDCGTAGEFITLDEAKYPDPKKDPNAIFIGDAGTYDLIWTVADCDYLVEAVINNCDRIDFDGDNDYITFKNNYDLDGPFSIEVWVKPDAQTESGGSNDAIQTIFSKRNANNLNEKSGYDLRIENNTVSFNWNDIGTLVAPHPIDTSRWFHIAITFNGSSYAMYIDGVFMTSGSGIAPIENRYDCILGAMDLERKVSNKPENYFSGWIDELRIWNRALDPEHIHQMMNQEITDNGTAVVGEVITIMNIHGPDNDQNGTDDDPLFWANLQGYYRMDQIDCGYLEPYNGVGVDGKLRNIFTTETQNAPLPYETDDDGNWGDVNKSGNDASSPWLWGHSVWDYPNALGIDGTRIDWNIVRISNKILSKEAGGAKGITLLGLVSEANELTMANDYSDIETYAGRMLWITHYLKLDGIIDLIGESQLLQKRYSNVQYSESLLDDASMGYIERDQQGTGNLYHYNDWSSPVGRIGQPKGTAYTVRDVLRDGTDTSDPLDIEFIGGYDGADGTPISIAAYWLYVYRNYNGDYSNWAQIGADGAMYEGEGFLMKGTGRSTTTEYNQNYVFIGKPHNGDIQLSVAPGWTYLSGNPYPSALDIVDFIDDNIVNTTGTVYFWEHWGTNTHILRDYQAGYAARTKLDGTVAPAVWDDVSGTKKPGRYVAVGQAFYVLGDPAASSGDFYFNNNQRDYVTEANPDESIFLKENTNKKSTVVKKSLEDMRLKVRLGFKIDDVAYRQLLFGVDENATVDYDKGYDGEMFGMLPNDMYMTVGEKRLVIQALGSLDLESAIPLGIQSAGDNLIQIKVEEVKNPYPNMEIYVRNNITMDTYDILNGTFETVLGQGEFNDIFSIAFKPKPEIPKKIEEEFEKINAFVIENSSVIRVQKPEDMEVRKIALFNIIGQQISVWPANFESNKIDLPINVNTGLYIIMMETNFGKKMKKIVIE